MEAIKQYQNNTRISCDTIEVGDLEMQQNQVQCLIWLKPNFEPNQFNGSKLGVFC